MGEDDGDTDTLPLADPEPLVDGECVADTLTLLDGDGENEEEGEGEAVSVAGANAGPPVTPPPSCPYVSSPQHATPPPAVRTHVW